MAAVSIKSNFLSCTATLFFFQDKPDVATPSIPQSQHTPGSLAHHDDVINVYRIASLASSDEVEVSNFMRTCLVRYKATVVYDVIKN